MAGGTIQKISPCLWFDGQAEEAASFYVSLFENSRIVGIDHYGDAGPGTKGGVMLVRFELEGQEFAALNGGPMFKFTPAISLFIHCDGQEEVDRLWERLGEGGSTMPCGWITDRFGVTWQVVPRQLIELLHDPDPERANRVMKAMMTMSKLEVAPLLEAAAGKA